MILSYRDLRVWQAGMDLAETVYRASREMPASEIYGLTSQIRRAAASVPANIAEGYGRESTGAYVQFLKTARGSLRELETHLLLAARLEMLERKQAITLIADAENIGKMLHALVRTLQTKKPAVR